MKEKVLDLIAKCGEVIPPDVEKELIKIYGPIVKRFYKIGEHFGIYLFGEDSDYDYLYDFGKIIEVNDIHSDTIDFIYEDKFKDTTTHEIISVPIYWVEISEEEFFNEMKHTKFKQLEGEMLNLMNRINEVKSMVYKEDLFKR